MSEQFVSSWERRNRYILEGGQEKSEQYLNEQDCCIMLMSIIAVSQGFRKYFLVPP